MKKSYLFFYALGIFLIQTSSYARIIRTETCIIPFDFTIKTLCVLSTLSLWIGIPLAIGIVASIFRSK
jgi:hypothetical protein